MFESTQAILLQPRSFGFQKVIVSPQDWEIVVKVAYCGLCLWELNHWVGALGSCPQTLGHEVSGTIVAVGKAVSTDFRIGQKVTGFVSPMAGFAEYATMPYSQCIVINDDVDLKQALAEPLSCVVTTMLGCDPRLGQTAAVVGCGPMGLWLIQLLATQGLKNIIAIDTEPARLALAKEFGATIGGTGVSAELLGCADFVVEATGKSANIGLAVELLKSKHGRLIIMSSYAEETIILPWQAIQSKGPEIHVTHPPYLVDQTACLQQVKQYINTGIFRSEKLITHVFPFKDMQKAFETLEHRPQGYIKGVVKIG